MGTGGTAVAAPGAVVLLAAGPDSAAVRACEALLFGIDGMNDLPDRLVDALDAPVSFALAAAGADTVHVSVRGAAWAAVDGHGEVRHAADHPYSTTGVAEDHPVTLLLDGSGEATGQWLTTGVIAAGAVVVGRLAAMRRTRAIPTIATMADPDFGNLVGLAQSADEGAAHAEPEAVAAPRQVATAPYRAPGTDVGHLVLDDGTMLALDAPILVGRRPPSEPIAGQRPITLVVDDALLSRHHATIRVLDGRLVVVDEHSTNGTVVTIPGSSPMPCMPGQPVEVPIGASVEIGGVLTVIHRRGQDPC